MKSLRNKTIFSILLVALVVFTSCKKNFLDINADPNRVTADNVTPELIFTQAATAVGARQATVNLRFLNQWMGYLAGPGDFAIDQTETSYNIDFQFGDAFWQNQYNVLFDLYQAKQKSFAEGDPVLAGASMILSAKLWQELVDIYGDVPYSQAFQNDVTRTPVYDKDVAIYASLQKSLDTAVGYMKKTAKSTFKSVDVVNNGDQAKWIKFANTLKLRLLIRQSQVSGFNPSSEIAKIVSNNTANILRSGGTVSENPGYGDETNKQSPFYANYGFTPTGTDANTSLRANVYLVNILTSTSDPRLKRIFAPLSNGSVVGTTFGLFSGNPLGANSSKFGPGLIGSASQDQWILTSVESLFLEAEAIARGWLTGNAQTAYMNAVTESFIWLGVPNAATAASTYMTNNAIANWANAGGTPLSQAKFIAFQKYIALAGLDPLETWADLRRINMIPNSGYISVNPSRISNTLPLRLLYPQSEYTTNSENVNGEGTINQFTTKLFWEP